MKNLKNFALACTLIFGIQAPVLAGDKPVLPAKIELSALEGNNKITKNDIAGKRVLVQFWAAWCVGCSKVMEDLIPYTPDGKQAMYLSVSLDETKDQARGYFKHQKDVVKALSKSSWIDPETNLATALQVKALPALVLIDSDGTVIENLYGHPTADQMKRISSFLK